MNKQGRRPGGIERLPSGNFRAKIKCRTSDGKDMMHSKTFQTQDAADDWLWQKGHELGLVKNQWCSLDDSTVEVQVGEQIAYFDIDDWEVMRRYTWTLDVPVKGYTTYLTTRIEGHKIRAHSLIVPKYRIVDHIDQNGLNNRKNNLREGSNGVNQRNCKQRSDNTTAHTGVYKVGKRWRAVWTDNLLGIRCSQSFSSKEEAIAHRKKMAAF